MDLDVNGYIVLRNVLSEDEIQIVFSSIKDDQVNYSRVKYFIDNIFLKRITQHCNTISNPHYVKFRLSDNNNSTDASTFHIDIYNHTPNRTIPIFTCLAYFDDAQMELIPQSHKSKEDWSIQMYKKRILLHVNRGDILIFNANIHHRGVNYGKMEHRRLLQVFEVFPNNHIYDEYSSKLYIVETSTNRIVKNIYNPLMYQLSKNAILLEIITFFHYILMYNGLIYKIGMVDIKDTDKTNNCITYEPGRKVKMTDVNTYDDINVNILCDASIQTKQGGGNYLYLYILYWIVSSILLYVTYK